MPHIGEVLGLAAKPAQGGSSGGEGANVVKGSATLTVPSRSYFHRESVALTGCAGSMIVLCSIAAHADDDENSEEMLGVLSLSAAAGTGTATVSIAFSEPTTGPVKINLLAV